MSDAINPEHYTSHPSGVECIEITEHMGFCLGNAVKYIWRAGLKQSALPVEDLRKAIWYLERELAKLQADVPETGDTTAKDQYALPLDPARLASYPFYRHWPERLG